MTHHTFILNDNKVSEILAKLNEQYGVPANALPEGAKLIKRGKEKIYLFTANLTLQDIKAIEANTPIEGIGMYLGKEDEYYDNLIRLSIEGVHLLKDHITKNIVEVDESQAQEWMMGRELLIPSSEERRGFVIMQHKDTKDFLGCGKASAEKITNFIPKARRLKEKN